MAFKAVRRTTAGTVRHEVVAFLAHDRHQS